MTLKYHLRIKLEVQAMQTLKRVRSLAIVLAGVAVANYAIALASGVPVLPESPRPNKSGVPVLPDSPRPNGSIEKSGVPVLPESPRPSTAISSGVPVLPESPRPSLAENRSGVPVLPESPRPTNN